jgi:hypothetical protein
VRKAQRENGLTPEQTQHKTAGQFARERVARAESLGHGTAYDKCNSGYKGTITTISPELMADAKLRLEIAARDNAINRRKGYSKELLAQSNTRLDEAFTTYQDLVTQSCLKEMMPRLETSENYGIRQVVHATKLAEKRAQWFYQQGNTDDPSSNLWITQRAKSSWKISSA